MLLYKQKKNLKLKLDISSFYIQKLKKKHLASKSVSKRNHNS